MLYLVMAFLGIVSSAVASPELRVDGPYFKDPQGRVVLLRGVNISGNSKSAPYLPFVGKSVTPPGVVKTASNTEIDFSQLDRLESWGMNVVRLLFVWEAYEPNPGQYDEAYLDKITQLADQAWKRGMFVVIDLHQDSFSRFVGPGCGAGFPAWVSGSKPVDLTKNCGPMWAVKTAISIEMHKAYTKFYEDTYGGRTRYLLLWAKLAAHFKSHPGVIGYDMINEPWGNERKQLGPLYEDAARVIRAEDPTSILFIEPHLLNVLGARTHTRLAKPTFDNFVYAPHFYDAVAASTQIYFEGNPLTELVFKRNPRQAKRWGVPLFFGEFGAFAKTTNVEVYVDKQYELMDHYFASGTQWNYTPDWTEKDKDGWNDEDYSIVDNDGLMRKNFKIRPYPRRTSGEPLEYKVNRGEDHTVMSVEYEWKHDPRLGTTEIYVPKHVLFDHDPVIIDAGETDLECAYDRFELELHCTAKRAGIKKVRVVRAHRVVMPKWMKPRTNMFRDSDLAL